VVLVNAQELRKAAGLIRRHAESAADPQERWVTDQSPDFGLVIGAFVPEDVYDGYISTGCVAYFAYPGDDDNRTHKHALGAAAHMSGLDPQAALVLSDWLVVAAERWGSDPAADRAALAFALSYLRCES
jgi:hypothetical protein